VKKEWFNDEKFWDGFSFVIFNKDRLDETGEAADGVTGLGGPGLLVLDLCCGIGRISMELARRGFHVTGIDVSETYLRSAGEEADKIILKDGSLEYIKKDVRKFRRKNAYDTVINLYNSFGFFEDPDDDLLMLKNAHYSLKEGGVFIVELLGKEIAVRDFSESDWFESEGCTALIECSPVDSWSAMWNRWVLFDGSRRLEKVFIQRLYSAKELKSLLLEAGFGSINFFGNWDESPYDEKAKTLIAVGKKQSELIDQ